MKSNNKIRCVSKEGNQVKFFAAHLVNEKGWLDSVGFSRDDISETIPVKEDAVIVDSKQEETFDAFATTEKQKVKTKTK